MAAADPFVDYYAVLGVQNTATAEQIDSAARRELQRWTKATTHPNLGRRQEAEQQVKNISEGRGVLLDPARRDSYDQEWVARAGRAVEAPASAGGRDRDWVALAQKYLTENDYQAAAYAAREATQRRGDNAQTWSLRAQANLGLDRYDDAVYEARQATELEPDNPYHHFTLAQAHEAAGHGQAAIASYETVARLDPESPGGMLGVVSVLLQDDRAGEALRVSEELRRQFPQDETVGYYLGWALVHRAEQVPRVKGEGSYVVTSAAELRSMRDLLERAKAATGDGDVRRAVASVEAYLDRMSRRTLHVQSGRPFRYVVIACVFLLAGLGLVQSAGFRLLGLVCLAVVAAMVLTAWVPQWKVNARAHSGRR
jgi:tetratricopeptide (TPR) repeat protein